MESSVIPIMFDWIFHPVIRKLSCPCSWNWSAYSLEIDHWWQTDLLRFPYSNSHHLQRTTLLFQLSESSCSLDANHPCRRYRDSSFLQHWMSRWFFVQPFFSLWITPARSTSMRLRFFLTSLSLWRISRKYRSDHYDAVRFQPSGPVLVLAYWQACSLFFWWPFIQRATSLVTSSISNNIDDSKIKD